MTTLIPSAFSGSVDSKGMRGRVLPQDIPSGTFFGQYQLRGSILVIKDAQDAASGYIAYGTSITTIPTSPTTGTGVYQDYRGIYGLSGGTQQFYLDSSDGKAYAGGGEVVLDDDGIQIATGIGNANAIRWLNGSTVHGELRTTIGVSSASINLSSYFSGGTSSVVVDAGNGTSRVAAVVKGDATPGYLHLYTFSSEQTSAPTLLLSPGAVTGKDGFGHIQLITPNPAMLWKDTDDNSAVRMWYQDFVFKIEESGQSNFGIDIANKRVGIGTVSPSSQLHLASTAPTFRMEDTTGSAKSLQIAVDGNVATFEEVAGPNQLQLDLANNRATFGNITDLTNATRVLNLIDSAGVMRIYRISSNLDTASPGFELIGSANVNDSSGSWTSYWDISLNASDQMILRRRTGGSNKNILTLSTNGSVICNSAAVATNATDGFLYVAACAGTPTGTPTAVTGRIPVVVDSTNNKMYIYSGGAWVALN